MAAAALGSARAMRVAPLRWRISATGTPAITEITSLPPQVQTDAQPVARPQAEDHHLRGRDQFGNVARPAAVGASAGMALR